jgi:NADP-dependent 3-hydroxy acid dehydrogenase YdfG
MAIVFAAQDFDIVLADVDATRLKQVADEVAGHGVEVLTCRTDVADQAAMDRLADAAFDRFGTPKPPAHGLAREEIG